MDYSRSGLLYNDASTAYHHMHADCAVLPKTIAALRLALDLGSFHAIEGSLPLPHARHRDVRSLVARSTLPSQTFETHTGPCTSSCNSNFDCRRNKKTKPRAVGLDRVPKILSFELQLLMDSCCSLALSCCIHYYLGTNMIGSNEFRGPSSNSHHAAGRSARG